MFDEMFDEATDYLAVMLGVVVYLGCMFSMMIITQHGASGIFVVAFALGLFIAAPTLIYLLVMSKLKFILDQLANNLNH